MKWLIGSGVLTIALSPLVLDRQLSQEQKLDGSRKADWSVFLPAGEGRSDVVISCSGCHDLRQVITQKKSKPNWSMTIQKMVSAYQAPLDKEDFSSVLGYLANNFGEDNPIDQLPIDINKCPIETLLRLPGISMEAAKAIVESRRADGPFASVDDLLRVRGIDRAEMEKIKPYIKTRD